ncbi:hypothetical protein MUK42_03476 [Musa troglodytarum]|uniref:Uncharacterized protein n=1 Tax=Musa troglodytarum TaxID=320322 RepID=A0A9E7G4V0_9LILI|nr:hypothetical protein MUK42_03476 [Musa troglodytarum]
MLLSALQRHRFPNTVGPMEETWSHGHPLLYLAPSACGHPDIQRHHMLLGPATNHYSTLKNSSMAPQSSSWRASGARQGSPTT